MGHFLSVFFFDQKTMPSFLSNTLRRIRSFNKSQDGPGSPSFSLSSLRNSSSSSSPMGSPRSGSASPVSSSDSQLNLRSASPAQGNVRASGSFIHGSSSPARAHSSRSASASPRSRRSTAPGGGEFPFEVSQYLKFGALHMVRRLHTTPCYVGLRDQFAGRFDMTTGALVRVYNLAGASVAGPEPHSIEFVITGPNIAPPWRLSASSHNTAIEWAQAFRTAIAGAHTFALELSAKEVAESRCFEYQRLIEDVIASAPVAAPGGTPLRGKRGRWKPACPGCEKSYNEKCRAPLVLHCQHSACLRCLQAMWSSGSGVHCPQCKELTKADSLPKNYALLDLRLKVRDSEFLRTDPANLLDVAGGACPVCLETFTQEIPLLLFCGHTVCAKCVLQMAECSSRGTIACPTCRQTTQLGATLQLNVSLQDAVCALVDVHRRRVTAVQHWRRLRWIIHIVCILKAAIQRPEVPRVPCNRAMEPLNALQPRRSSSCPPRVSESSAKSMEG